MTTITNARDAAVAALRDRGGNISARLRRLLGGSRLPAREQALATELALGVVRRRGTLRAILRAFLHKPGRPLPGPLEEILLVALYQVLFLDRVPDFAAVDEAVRQTGRLHHKRQGGLVNGLLRAVVRSVSEPLEGAPPVRADVVPVGPASYRTARGELFPDPDRQPAAFLAAAWSLPEALADRWLKRFGSLPGAIEVAAHACARPPLICRVNRLRATVPEAIERLAAEGVEAHPHANGCSVVLAHRQDVRGLGAFAGGLLQPQDPSATAVGFAAAPRPGQNVLDLCAAPGTKTTHLAGQMDNTGSILALDVSDEKLRLIRENCDRLGVGIVRTRLAPEIGGIEPGSFDLVLADVPCSNTGVLARRPEARWRFSEEALASLVADQKNLAAQAVSWVRAGGRVVYSTCSLEPEEGPAVVAGLRERFDRLELVAEKLTLPSGAVAPAEWSDGGYFAVLRSR